MKKISLAMTKMSNQLSLIANNIVAGKYKSSEELKKVQSSLFNAMKTCDNAFAATAGKIKTKAHLITASKSASAMDQVLDTVLSNHSKAQVLAQVVKSEIGDMEDMEAVTNVDDNIDAEDFGTDEDAGTEASNGGQLSGDDVQTGGDDLDDGIPAGEDNVQEAVGADKDLDSDEGSDLGDDTTTDGDDLDELTFEGGDEDELEDFMDDDSDITAPSTPAPTTDAKKAAAKKSEAKKQVSTSSKVRTNRDPLAGVFNFKI